MTRRWRSSTRRPGRIRSSAVDRLRAAAAWLVKAARAGVGRPLDVLAVLLVAALIVGWMLAAAWAARHALAVNRLASGVGDVVFYGGDGRPWFRLDERRRDVPLAQIAPALQHAVLATEDRRFFWHPGIDPLGLTRAMWVNLRSGQMREGASTLTQQLARTLFLSNRRTAGRKIQESVIAVMLELRLSKSQILELYLNRVYLSAGLYGVEALSHSAFGKRARDLTLAEAALVAGLVQAPSALSPWSNLEGARRRSETVLARMVDGGVITERQAREACATRIRVRPYPAAASARHGYAKEYLRQQFRDRFGGDQPPDWEVHSTVLPRLQDAAEQAVSDGLSRLGVRGLQAALVALDPETGNVLAMVGGRDFRESQFNRAWRSRRQPGSAFKPWVFALALSEGRSPVSELSGLSTLAPQGDEEWTPRNASGTVDDRLTLREAFFESNNRAAVMLQQRLGGRNITRIAARAGLENQPNVPSLALGAGVVTPLALTASYAAFVNGGARVRPRAIVRVVDQDGGVVLREPVQRERVLSPEVAYQMVTLMQDVIARGTGTAVQSWGVRGAIAGKTGTTNDFKDAWFVGFSPRVVVGVWVGFDQPATIRRDGTGGRVALPIWASFMRRAERTVSGGTFPPPATMEAEDLCRVTFRQPVNGCPLYTEYFKPSDAKPRQHCQLHEGSIRQRVQRTVERAVVGLLRGLWDRVTR
jgi:1A family penicillin-binding protein